MNIFATILVGSYRLAVDKRQVLKVCPERSGSSEFLGDWQAFKKEQGESAAGIPLHSLTQLLTGQTEEFEGRRRLVVLADESSIIGVMVNGLESEYEVTDDLVQPLPSAFPEGCRRYFPQVVICGEQAVPVLTVSALLEVAGREMEDNR